MRRNKFSGWPQDPRPIQRPDRLTLADALLVIMLAALLWLVILLACGVGLAWGWL